jgi:ADP/ATP carrier protein family
MQSLIYRVRNSNFRHAFCPVRSGELLKFLPMAMLMFTILLNQNILRGIKDSLVMTLVGPEVISFIKLWCELPAGIIFVLIYTKICNHITTESAFRWIVCTFLCFFSVFAFVIFPNASVFHPDPVVVQQIIMEYPHAKWFVVIWSKWSFILFYVMGELWPIIVFSLLFWQLANKITTTNEAQRFYTFFGLFGQTNLLFSGYVIVYFASGSHIFNNLFLSVNDKTEVMLKSLMIIVMISGAVLLAIHMFITERVMSDSKYYTPKPDATDVLKLSVRESMKLIISSKYLCWICLLMISYGTTINLIEGMWMSKARELYSTPESFIAYMGNVLFATGICTLLISLCGSAIIRRYGWYIAAIITPMTITLFGGIFFMFVIFQDKIEIVFDYIPGITALSTIVFIGALQNVFGKGSKYSMFDATKEMAYIPLNDEIKTKGKAAVDVIGSKIGKSSGAALQFCMFTVFPQAHYDDLAVYLFIMFVATCMLWIYGVKKLSSDYLNIVKNSY